MNLKNRLFLALTGALLLTASNAQAAEIFRKVGTAGAQFLKIGVGARAVGMGETFVAVADDYPRIRRGLLDFVTQFEAAIAKEVARAFPKARADQCRRAGAGIAAIYFNTEAIGPLRPAHDWLDMQRKAAMALLAGL